MNEKKWIQVIGIVGVIIIPVILGFYFNPLRAAIPQIIQPWATIIQIFFGMVVVNVFYTISVMRACKRDIPSETCFWKYYGANYVGSGFLLYSTSLLVYIIFNMNEIPPEYPFRVLLFIFFGSIVLKKWGTLDLITAPDKWLLKKAVEAIQSQKEICKYGIKIKEKERTDMLDEFKIIILFASQKGNPKFHGELRWHREENNYEMRPSLSGQFSFYKGDFLSLLLSEKEWLTEELLPEKLKKRKEGV